MSVERNGYGAHFNTLEIRDLAIYKSAKTKQGENKISKEINFYKYLIENQLEFPVPTILSQYPPTGYSMTYLKYYTELCHVFFTWTPEKQHHFVNILFGYLNKLHQHRKYVSIKNVKHDLYLETIGKIQTRMCQIKHLIDKYSFIHIVKYKEENIIIHPIQEITNKIKSQVDKYIESLDDYVEYSLIHGDCQFNNVLINNNEGIVFIDPRGYFGDTPLFGLPEYDLAKINFALSGYDEFDNRNITHLCIHEETVEIELHMSHIQSKWIHENNLTQCLLLSIWLSNAHAFVDNEFKCMHSYFIAMFLASKYLFRNDKK